MVPKHLYFGHAALALVLVFALQSFAASVSTSLESLKRDRPSGSSTLIAFPRVGRSSPLESAATAVQDHQPIICVRNSNREALRLLYGQKRTGKSSSLIPFPRVGRSDPTMAKEIHQLDNANEIRNQKRPYTPNESIDIDAIQYVQEILRELEANNRI